MKKINWIEILFWIVLIALIIMILTRIFGNSSTDIQIYITISLGMITIMSYIVRMNRELGEIKMQMVSSFKKIREDINKIIKEENRKKP